MAHSSGAEFKPGEPEWFMNLGISSLFILGAGIFSGLTMSVVGLDPTTIQILSRAGTEVQKKQAQKLLWFVSPAGFHLSLVTLLIANACSTESLPIFLDKAVGEVGSIILGATFVLLFGEVIPIALFTGTHQLAIAATLSPVVYVLIFLFCPLAWPISKLMDCVLGHGEEGAKFRRSELVEFVRMHEAEGGSPAAGARGPRREDSSMAMELNTVSSAAGAGAETGAAGKGKGDKGGDKGADGVKAQLSTLVEKQGGAGAGGGGAGGGGVAEEGATLTPAEVKILTGVLGMVKKVASSRMTPLRRVVMLPSTAVLDHDTMRTVSQSGYSRIPIFDADAGRQSIVGVFIPKLLLRVDPDARVPVDVLTLLQPPFVYESTHLLDVLDILRIAKTHLAIVVKDPSNPHVRPDDDVAAHEAVGILTLEDVLEELIMEKIGDESQILVGEDTMTRFRRVAGRKPSSSTPKKSSSSSSSSAPKAAARAAPAPPRTEGAAVLSTAPLARDEDEAHV